MLRVLLSFFTITLIATSCGDDDGGSDAATTDTGSADVGPMDSGRDTGNDDAGGDDGGSDDGGSEDAGEDAGGDDASTDAAADAPTDALMSDSGVCDAITEEYERLITEGQRCEAPGTCVILNGHCGIGIGGCYHGASGLTQEELDAVAERWRLAGCTGPVCDCPAPPESVRCDAGGCLLRF